MSRKIPETPFGYPWPPHVLDDPYPFYAQLRAEAPVARVPGTDVFVLSRYGDVEAALRDWRAFSSAEGPTYARIKIGGAVSLDPPEHTRVRRLAQVCFRPSKTRALEARVEEIVAERLDRALESGEVEFVEAVTDVLPILMICHLLELPTADAPMFRRWADEAFEMNSAVSADAVSSVVDSFAASLEYFSAVLAERAANPGDDPFSILLQPTPDGERLADDEILTMARGLLTAGNGTTRALLGNGTWCLARNPDQWELLRSRPELADDTVEETLRYESPLQGFFRTVTEPLELRGVETPAGARVFLLYGSANRDEEVYPDAASYRVARPASGHLAFGAGPHFCLGSDLARLQGRVLFREMARRFDRLELSDEARLRATPVSRGVSRLPLRITAQRRRKVIAHA